MCQTTILGCQESVFYLSGKVQIRGLSQFAIARLLHFHNSMKHYIYAYVDPRDNVVRYVGQGQNERWLASHKHNEQYGVYPWLQCLKSLGLEPIRLIVLEYLTQKQADLWEIGLIDLIGRQCEETGPLLNLAAGGTSNKPSTETRERLSKANKNRTITAEHRKHLSEAGKGKTFTEEHRKHLSEARKNCSAETRKKLSDANKGKTSGNKGKPAWNKGKKGKPAWTKGKKAPPRSEETLKRMSDANKGKIPWNKGKKIKPHSKDARKNMSDARNKYLETISNQSI